MLHRGRLIGDLVGLDADRQIGQNGGHGRADVLAEHQHVAAVAHRDGKADRFLAVDAEQRLRRIGRPARDLGDVAEADQPAIGGEVDGQDVLLRLEAAGRAHQDLLVGGFHHAGRGDGVLRLKGGDQRRLVEAEPGDLVGRELDVDALVLHAEHVDLRHVGDLQQARADILDIVAQLPAGKAVGGEAVDDAVGVAELVVEPGAEGSLRQRILDVAHLLADLIPDVRNIGLGRRSLQRHENGGDAGLGVALDVVEMRRFLELALDALGQLLQRLIDGRPRPLGLDHHGLDGEGGVLAAPEAGVAPGAGQRDHQHEIEDQRSVADRPGGKVEPLFHVAPPRRRTF